MNPSTPIFDTIVEIWCRVFTGKVNESRLCYVLKKIKESITRTIEYLGFKTFMETVGCRNK